MSITEPRPGVWLLDVRAWVGGKEHRKRETFKGDKWGAEERYYEIRKVLRTHGAMATCSLTVTKFRECVEYFLAHREIDRRSMPYLNRLKVDLGQVPVPELRERFDQYLLLLRKEKSAKTGRPFSNQTVNHFIKWARAALNLCVRAGLVKANPIEHLQMLRTMPRDRILSEDEQRRLIKAVESVSPRLLPIVTYAIAVPSRLGELTTLRRTDYDMVNNVVRIPAERTKNRRPVIKPVPPGMMDYFRSVPAESEWLFYRKQGRRYVPLGDFRKSWHTALEAAGIDGFKFHDLRRCSYSALVLAGNAPHVVSKVSGHRTDMSRVYFGVNELVAAKSIKWAATG